MRRKIERARIVTGRANRPTNPTWAPATRFELATSELTARRSTELSYAGSPTPDCLDDKPHIVVPQGRLPTT